MSKGLESSLIQTEVVHSEEFDILPLFHICILQLAVQSEVIFMKMYNHILYTSSQCQNA